MKYLHFFWNNCQFFYLYLETSHFLILSLAQSHIIFVIKIRWIESCSKKFSAAGFGALSSQLQSPLSARRNSRVMAHSIATGCWLVRLAITTTSSTWNANTQKIDTVFTGWQIYRLCVIWCCWITSTSSRWTRRSSCWRRWTMWSRWCRRTVKVSISFQSWKLISLMRWKILMICHGTKLIND